MAATIADVKAMLSHLAQVDPLLLDVYMHTESGTDLLPALRADGRNIDVIMMTSAADALTSRRRCAMACDYLIKPFPVVALLEALRTWRNKRDANQAKSCYAGRISTPCYAAGFCNRTVPAALPKGLTPQTLRHGVPVDNRRIRRAIFQPIGAGGGAADLPVSYRKYLIWLEQIQRALHRNHYGITGRPEYALTSLSVREPDVADAI